MILVDRHQRHEPLARIGQRDRDRPGIQIEDSGRIERVAVLSGNQLLVERCRRAGVVKLAEAVVLNDRAKGAVGFGADEVISGKGNGVARWWGGRRLRLNWGDRTRSNT